MAGTLFSGWFGRRSSRPYFDELPRITIADCKQNAPGLIFFSWQGQSFAVRKIIAAVGCMNVPRLICVRCNRGCRVLYVLGAARCYQCTPAIYRTHSESLSRRAVRAALKVWRKHVTKIDYTRPAGKPKWMRWPTYKKREAAADAVFHFIERADCAPYEALTKLEAKINAPKRKRGRPPKC